MIQRALQFAVAYIIGRLAFVAIASGGRGVDGQELQAAVVVAALSAVILLLVERLTSGRKA
ncbi:MAG: hypothetical protein JSS36_10790 [Proteobacteria bacterium]|nr:hypothetical protein [Pseudomonadota bacterium]